MVDTQASREASATLELPRVERRFSAQAGARRRLGFALGMPGMLLLGAGTFGSFIASTPLPFSGYLLLAAALLLAGAGFLSSAAGPAVRIGDLGVALERSGEVVRLAWHEIKSVRLVGHELALAGESASLSLPLAAHPQAAREVIAQAARRIPERVELSPNAHDRLPPASGAVGEAAPVLGFQVTGRRCMASGTPITFAADARLCPSCGAIYHVRSVPAACKACGAALVVPFVSP